MPGPYAVYFGAVTIIGAGTPRDRSTKSMNASTNPSECPRALKPAEPEEIETFARGASHPRASKGIMIMRRIGTTISAFANLGGRKAKPPWIKYVAQEGDESLEEPAAQQIFQEHDSGAGVLTFKEFATLIRAVAQREGNPERLTMAQLDVEFNRADRNLHSRVNLADFVAFYPGFLIAQRELALNAKRSVPPRNLARSLSRARLAAATRSNGKSSSQIHPASTGPAIAGTSDATERSVSLRTLRLDQMGTIEACSSSVSKVAESELSAGAASRSKVQKLLHLPVRDLSERQHRVLSDLFVAASAGNRFGIHKVNSQYEVVSANQSFEAHKMLGEGGRIDLIRLRGPTFARLCESGFGIKSDVLQQSLFRVLKGAHPPGAASSGQESVSFQDLLQHLSPLLNGSKQQQSAFMFRLYDMNDDGIVKTREFFSIQGSLDTDSTIEKDVLAFYNSGMDLVVFINGQCDG